MPAQYIGDGYNAVKTFEKNPFYDRTIVTYRPLTGVEQRLLRLKLTDIDRPGARPLTEESIKAGEDYAAEYMAGRILSWDVVDGGGHPVPVTAKGVKGLAPQLGADLLNLLIGEIPPDPEPEKAPLPPAEQEAADAKN